MSAVASFAGFMKKHVLGQTLIRRNPYYYERSLDALAQGEAPGIRTAPAWVDAAGAAHAAAREAHRLWPLGARWRELSSWPLLDKESLRHGLESFTTGNQWLSAPATTGGTSGVPLKVLRSLEAIVFEQATIDRVIQSVGVDARTARTAVLRGDNPRDIVVSPNPDCEVINAGRIMTMSANAVTHTSVEHIANSLENVRAAIAVRLSERARDAGALPAR